MRASNAATRMSGGEAIARTLKACGVEFVFGMTGGQTPFTASVIAQGMRMATVRDERCGALMAIGYARLSGKPGVCTSADIGTAHLAVGMHEAFQSSNPIVAITSDLNPARAWRTAGRFIDQQSLFGPLTKWTVRVEALDTLPAVTREALRVACAGGPGPTAMIVPNTLLGGEGEFDVADTAGGALTYPFLRVSPDREAVRTAARMLLDAPRAAIVAGGGVRLSGATRELAALAEASDIPVATTHIAHGTFRDGHRLSAGVLGDPAANGRGRIANAIVAAADVVLLVGTRADGSTTRGWTLPGPEARIIHIDIDPAHIDHNLPVEVPIVSDAKLALGALREEFAQIADQRTPRTDGAAEALAELQHAWRRDFTSQMDSESLPMRPPRLFRELQKVINRETVVTVDAGSCSYWAAAFLEATPENEVLYPRGFPALGSGLPMALGAQCAAPRKQVLAVAGDGAFGYNIMEFETALRLELPVVNVVLNNATLGMEWPSFLRFCGEALPDAVRFKAQNFAAIAEAFGCFGVRVERPKDVAEAVQAAFASGKPAVVEVLTDPTEDSTDEVPWRLS